MLALADVKAWLNVTGTADDALLTDLDARVQAFLEKQSGRYFGPPKAFVEVLDGGREALRLVEPPRETPPATVEERVGAGLWSPVTTDPAWEIDGFWIYREDRGCWTAGRRKFRVSYEAGYDPEDIPGDVVQVALDLIADRYRGRGAEGLQSETLGEYSYTRSDYTRDDLERLGWWATVEAWRHVSIP